MRVNHEKGGDLHETSQTTSGGNPFATQDIPQVPHLHSETRRTEPIEGWPKDN